VIALKWATRDVACSTFDFERTPQPTLTLRPDSLRFIFSAPGVARWYWTARGRFLNSSAWN